MREKSNSYYSINSMAIALNMNATIPLTVTFIFGRSNQIIAPIVQHRQRLIHFTNKQNHMFQNKLNEAIEANLGLFDHLSGEVMHGQSSHPIASLNIVNFNQSQSSNFIFLIHLTTKGRTEYL